MSNARMTAPDMLTRVALGWEAIESLPRRADRVDVDSDWNVVERGDAYYLEVYLPTFDAPGKRTFCVIEICPTEWPIGLAIDAATEFMDRTRERNWPSWVSSDEDLMRFCTGQARRQR